MSRGKGVGSHKKDKQAQLAAATDIELQRMKSAAGIKIAEIGAEAKGAQVVLETDAEREALALDRQHEAMLQAMDQAHTLASQGVQTPLPPLGSPGGNGQFSEE